MQMSHSFEKFILDAYIESESMGQCNEASEISFIIFLGSILVLKIYLFIYFCFQTAISPLSCQSVPLTPLCSHTPIIHSLCFYVGNNRSPMNIMMYQVECSKTKHLAYIKAEQGNPI